MESSDITFLNLPYDIIHEICDHLTDKQILKLRFVSKKTSSNIPKSRLDKIFAKRTLRFTDIEAIRFLHLLNTSSDEDLARTRHLVFDLSNPYVGLIPSEAFHRGRWRYSEHMKSKMMVFHGIYKERNMRDMASGIWKPRDPKTVSMPDNLPSASHPEYCYKELYRILEEDIECPDRYDQHAYSSSKMINSLLPFNKLAFFDALTAVFRQLPNLSIIEFKISDPPKRPEYRIPQAWIRHNLSLKHFLDKHPESKYLPCGDWFGPLGSMIDLEVAYPAVLYCATQANCRISEIKADQFPQLIVSSFGADIRNFDSFNCGTPTSPIPGSIDFKHLDKHLSDYQPSDWKNDEGCRYRAGSLETPGIKIFEKRMKDEVRWKEESGWEDFCGLFEGDNLTQDIGYWDG
ncbi:hypothetical protein TWF569_003384 [Orbilia oligospora]|nr:hypothetical protein TWF569_003384 [Orbilia oligospora]